MEEALESYERALSLRLYHAEALSSRLLQARAREAVRAVQARAREAVRARPESRDVSLTVLSVAHPLGRVGPDAVGGAEQILTMLDRALVEAGHRSIVVAGEGSHCAGTLVAVRRPAGFWDSAVIMAARRHYGAAIRAALQRWPVDLVHMHGLDYYAYLPPPGIPVLATLHGPPEFYTLEALRPSRPGTFLNCVSANQHAGFDKLAHLLAPIENGIAVGDYEGRHAKRGFALLMCRICPEKGVHLAIDAAKRAGIPLVIAGETSPYPSHQAYFFREVQPRLDHARRFIGPVGLRRKRRLLAAARCLLIPSLFVETSSLVAREALAAGTPVVAFPSGALVDVVDHGRTGYLVKDVQQMAEAIAACAVIDPAVCRRIARERFSVDGMIERYFGVYAALAATRQRL